MYLYAVYNSLSNIYKTRSEYIGLEDWKMPKTVYAIFCYLRLFTLHRILPLVYFVCHLFLFTFYRFF